MGELKGKKAGGMRRPRGRPRVFDTNAALEAAMRLFWEKGYEGTSVLELTTAMSISRPSLYAAFGGKEGLFRQVLSRYADGPASYVQAALDAPTGWAAAEQFVYGAVDLLCDPSHPPGCLVTQGALFCGDESEPARRLLAGQRQGDEAALRARLERAVQDGELPPGADAAALAAYFATIVRGLGISALSGATRDALLAVANMALRVWPSP